MALHSNAWSGIEILIFGKDPLGPSRLEESIAAAAPAQELRIHAYENFNEAHTLCKARRTVGFFLLQENSGPHPLGDVFTELAKPYESRGFPAFGFVLHKDEPGLNAVRALRRCSGLLGLLHEASLLDQSRVQTVLKQIWDSYTRAFESTLLPDPLKASLKSLAESTLSPPTQLFADRATELMSAHLNISWLDYVALTWAETLRAVNRSAPLALGPHQVLKSLCELEQLEACRQHDLVEIPRKQHPLWIRSAALIAGLRDSFDAGQLETTLDKLSALGTPGSPALFRILKSQRQNLLRIAADCSSRKVKAA